MGRLDSKYKQSFMETVFRFIDGGVINQVILVDTAAMDYTWLNIINNKNFSIIEL